MRTFTIYDPVTGDIIRSGTCQDNMVNAQMKSGEAVLADVQAHYLRDKIDLTGTPKPVRRSDAEIEERTPQVTQNDPLAVIVEALKSKGITITDSDLAAAADRIDASTTPATIGK